MCETVPVLVVTGFGVRVESLGIRGVHTVTVLVATDQTSISSSSICQPVNQSSS